MDNQYGKKLPSAVLPTVTGENYVLVEASDGSIVFIDSNGPRMLLDRDKAFPVGTVLCRANDISPASDMGGTWQNIAQGRAIIGASDAYPLGSTGGEETHTITVNEMPAHNHGLRYTYNAVALGSSYPAMGSVSEYQVGTGSIETAGGGQSHNNMQPYVAKNYWQRIA